MTIYISKAPSGFCGYIIDGIGWGFRIYLDYTKREAIRKYREEYGLKYRRLKIVDNTK